jgi:biotin carboxyl carrier protein
MIFWVKVGSEEKRVLIEETGRLYSVEIDGRKRLVDCRTVSGEVGRLSLIIDNRSYVIESAPVRVDEGTYYTKIAGRRYDLEIFDERLTAVRQASPRKKENGPYVIRSPMPGLIIDVRVSPGDRVAPESTVVVVEAMKMQNELLAEVNGIVRSVNVKPRDTVESKALLLEIERTG